MRATSIIFRRELGSYLRSPIGWVIISVLLLVNGILFQAFAMRGEQLSAIVLETYFNFSSMFAATAGVLLSFRLLAEERQNHSMVLLTTSPVRDTEIVLGKFFAALTFLALFLVLSLYMPLLIKVNGKITGAQILVGYLGLFLIGATGLAVGLFASALTRSQLIALLVAAALMVILGNVYQLATRLDPPVRDVLEQVDIWWVRFQNSFMRGILNLKDVVFYLATIYFFLLLAVKTLESKRWQ
jgi:ABC-2 type transport system permease protein